MSQSEDNLKLETESNEERCFFCGKSFLPSKRAKGEHYIPQWLIAMTGDKNRKVRLPESDVKMKIEQFPKSHVPAHPDCNTAWKDKESNAKKTFEKILSSGGTANAEELSNLLDWFDKVRWGLFWHPKVETPDQAFLGISPRTGADERVGLHDRMLIISNISPDHKGLHTIGINTPIFLTQPSVVTLFINGFSFTSVSDAGILAKDLVLPYPLFNQKTKQIEIRVVKDPFTPIDPSFLAQDDPDAFVIAQAKRLDSPMVKNSYGYSNKANHFNSLSLDEAYPEVMIWNGEIRKDHMLSHYRTVSFDEIRKSTYPKNFMKDLFDLTYRLQLKYLSIGYPQEAREKFREWGEQVSSRIQSDGGIKWDED